MEQNQFEALGIPESLAEVLSGQGITVPTAIQQQAIPKIREGRSLIGQAPTGTGKTLAYLLPLLQGLRTDLPQAQALVLAPTYELAMQIARVAEQLVQDGGMDLRVQALIGGANINRQIEKLKKKPQLIVGSAGRILELSRKGKLKLGQVKVLVLDEFDRLLDDQNLGLTRELIQALPDYESLQYLMFSATAPKKARERAGFLNEPEFLQVKEDLSMPKVQENLYAVVPFRQKTDFLRRLTRNLSVQRGLVFINRSFSAERALAKLNFEGIRAGTLLGNAGKMERKQVLADFEKGKLQLLLSTDLAARGLDISGVDYVINLDFPDTAQTYIHRAGRTARAGAEGRVVTLVDPKELHHLKELEKSLGIRFRELNRKRKS